jgi:hypothetical protein
METGWGRVTVNSIAERGLNIQAFTVTEGISEILTNHAFMPLAVLQHTHIR